MNRTRPRRALHLATLCLAALCLVPRARAAPFAERVRFVQPDGVAVELWGEGDEFQAVFETLDGYTVVFDPAAKTYFYAALSPDGDALLATPWPVGTADPRALGLAPHLRVSPAAAAARAHARFRIWDEATRTSEGWRDKKAALQAADRAAAEGRAPLSPPSFTTTGTKVGLCLLIDFSDDPATVPQTNILNFCNGDGYTGYGNNGSVKSYFQDNSNNLLTYTNIVTVYIRMAQPKSFYNDTSKDNGTQANLLIRDAVALMKALPNYADEIAPAFASLTLDASSRAVACNVFYAGGNGGVWSYGLWPHSWSLYNVGKQEIAAGIYIYKYQATNIGASLALGTFCHENGHMLCGFPDIYDYEADSSGGAGQFCLMNSGGSGGNPAQICAYLKRASGWATTLELTSSSSLAASLSSAGEGFNTFYRYAKPGVPTEYYLLENRQKSGRDAGLPAAGIAVWHVDEAGKRDNQSLAYNTNHANYEVTLVQADNKWDFQRKANSGDTNDLYYSGNAAAGYLNRFDDTGVPRARWWDGSVSGVNFSSFSANATHMTFSVEPAGVTLVTLNPLPTGFVGVPYGLTLTATNGTPPYSWDVVSNALPPGLTLSGEGVLSGTPVAETNAAFRVRAADLGGLCATNLFTLSAYTPRGLPFMETFEGSGKLTNRWTLEYVAGTTDWSLRNGGYGGYPAAAHGGSYNAWLYTAYSNAKGRKTRLVSPMLDLGEAPQNAQLTFWQSMNKRANDQDTLSVFYRTNAAAAWTALASYTTNVTAWVQRSVALPNPGRTYFLAFEGTANYGYGVCVDDVLVTSASSAPFILTPGLLPTGYGHTSYSQTLAAAGGSLPYTWEVVSNALPQGLTLGSGGEISGEPGVETNVTVRIRVTGGNGLSATNLFSVATLIPRGMPWAESFENSGKIPGGWTLQYVAGTVAWAFQKGGYNSNPSAAHGGNYNACLYSSTKGRVTRLVSPMLDFGVAPPRAQVTFWHCMNPWAGDQDALRVYYRTAAAGAWTLLEAYTNGVSAWTERTLPLPSPSRTYFLAFEGIANDGYGVCVDDVQVDAPYARWRGARFSLAELADGEVSGDAADPDGDGVANLLEYALGLDPRAADTAGLPGGGVLNRYLTLNYRRSKQAPEIVYEVEACTNLTAGGWSTNGLTELSRADSNLWWAVTTRHDVPVTNAPARFMRLKVSLPQ